MHASWGMDEKWLIIYPKMNEIVRLTLTLFPTPLGGFSLLLVASYFSFFLCLLNFWWLLYFDIIISNMYVHFHHYFIASILFNARVFVICMLPLPYSSNCSIFCILLFFLWDHCDIAFNLSSIFDRFKLSLIVQSQRLVGRFLHSLKALLTYFQWRLAVAIY